MTRYPYAFHVGLDGNGLNGVEGHGGACVLFYDPASNDYEFKAKFYEGIAAGHAVSVNPTNTVGFLGNFGQQLLFYDATTLEEVARISTLRFEPNDTSVRGSTHLVWLDEHHFITAIGEYLYRFDLRDLTKPEKLGPHRVKIPHAMKLSASKRYIGYGSIDHPAHGEAKEIGIWDMKSGTATRIELPTTCWHLTRHPTKDLFYPISFRVMPTEHENYHQWGIAYFKQYAYEVDAAANSLLRHWTAHRSFPAHLSSDVCISDSELIFCAPASHAIVFIDLTTFAKTRLLDDLPGPMTLLRSLRQIGSNMYETLTRGSLSRQSHQVFSAIEITRFTNLDGTYATQLSADQKLLFTAHRGVNQIIVYDYPSNERRLIAKLPELQQYFPRMHRWEDPRLGLHHGYLVGPPRAAS
jgi:hypothetical protein